RRHTRFSRDWSSDVCSSDLEDDVLEALYRAGRIQPYRVLERGGLRFGLFGLMGRDAVEVSPLMAPVTFADPVATAQDMVRLLRRSEERRGGRARSCGRSAPA